MSRPSAIDHDWNKNQPNTLLTAIRASEASTLTIESSMVSLSQKQLLKLKSHSSLRFGRFLAVWLLLPLYPMLFRDPFLLESIFFSGFFFTNIDDLVENVWNKIAEQALVVHRPINIKEFVITILQCNILYPHGLPIVSEAALMEKFSSMHSVLRF